MPNHSDDPPESFAIANQRFTAFLIENDYPQNVKWIFAEDLVVGKDRKYWVRQRLGDGLEEANLRYAEGVAKGLGVELRAVCATAEETFATVYTPKDEIDAEYHLIGRCLKLSCPTEQATVCKVRNRLKWFLLLQQDEGRSRSLLE